MKNKNTVWVVLLSILAIVGFLAVGCPSTPAGTPTPNPTVTGSTFEYIRSSSSEDDGRCVIELAGGGYLVGGVTGETLLGGDGSVLVRLDSSGGVVWDKTYDGLIVEDICEAHDGGFLILGLGGDLVKVDDSGEEVWRKDYKPQTSNMFTTSIVRTSDGNYAIAGGTGGVLIGGNDNSMYMLLFVIDTAGQVIWEKNYSLGMVVEEPLEWASIARKVQECTSGGFILAGASYDRVANDSMASFARLLRTDANGNRIWSKHYVEESFYSECMGVVEHSDGTFSATVDHWTNGFGGLATRFLRVGVSGEAVTEKEIAPFRLSGLARTQDGKAVVCGTIKYADDNMDIQLIKHNLQGNAEWSRSYGGPTDEEFGDIAVTGDGGLVVAGSKVMAQTGQKQLYVVRTKSDGRL